MNRTAGLVGCGAVAQLRYVPTMLEWQNIKEKYVYDIVPENAAAVALELNAKAIDLDTLIEKSDIIIITSPPHTHYEILQKAVKKGKTVICEKPFLVKQLEAESILDQAATTGAQLYVAHMRRVFPSTILARQLVSLSVLGHIKSVEIHEGGRFAYKTKSSYETKNFYGGVLLDTGSHALDQFLYICSLDKGNLEINITDVTRNKPEPSHDFKASFKVTANGLEIPVLAKFSRLTALSNTIHIFFEKGEMIIPLGMDNGLRIKNNNVSTMLYGRESLPSFDAAFTIEYDNILFKNQGEDFKAERFLNLTMILEKLLNFNQNA